VRRIGIGELRKDVVIELHNEPNLNSEGLDQTWHSVDQFKDWWIDVLNRYRQALPGQRFLFPGLSPGPDDQTTMGGRRINDRRFLEGCRPAVELADGLAMHAYWSNPHFPMETDENSGINLVDDYIRRFPHKKIWITECSNNLGDDWDTKVQEYRRFWQAMQGRPTVQGITFFVASAAGDDFKHETWMGRGVAARLGER
ncbi:MAG: glycosyl hydrolase, partial [Chloroflexota bacterium]